MDVSGESLDACRSRLVTGEPVEFEQQDFRNLEYANGSYDLIMASISVHHLVSSEKQHLFEQCYNWLTEDGILSFADQCAGATDDLNDRHMHNWKELSFNAGSSLDECH